MYLGVIVYNDCCTGYHNGYHNGYCHTGAEEVIPLNGDGSGPVGGVDASPPAGLPKESAFEHDSGDDVHGEQVAVVKTTIYSER